MTTDNDVLAAAEAAFEAGLDRDFGEEWITTIVGNAFADALEVLQANDARPRDIDLFLRQRVNDRTRQAIRKSLSEYRGDHLREAVADDLGYEDIETLATMIGDVEWLGGCDSSAFAVMTAGSIDVHAISRNGFFATYQSGDDALDGGCLEGLRAESEDPALRETRLEVAARFGGLSPGTRIAGQHELDAELRDLTFQEASHWQDMYDQKLRCDLDWVDELVEQHLAGFTTATGLDPDRARERLRAVVASGDFENDVERDVVWAVWKELRGD